MMEKIHSEEITSGHYLPDFGDRRCVGYYNNLEDAMRAISICNLHRDSYEYCIIEEIEEGVYKDTPQRWLFKLNEENEYVQIAEPQIISNVRNFGLG